MMPLRSDWGLGAGERGGPGRGLPGPSRRQRGAAEPRARTEGRWRVQVLSVMLKDQVSSRICLRTQNRGAAVLAGWSETRRTAHCGQQWAVAGTEHRNAPSRRLPCVLSCRTHAPHRLRFGVGSHIKARTSWQGHRMTTSRDDNSNERRNTARPHRTATHVSLSTPPKIHSRCPKIAAAAFRLGAGACWLLLLLAPPLPAPLPSRVRLNRTLHSGGEKASPRSSQSTSLVATGDLLSVRLITEPPNSSTLPV